MGHTLLPFANGFEHVLYVWARDFRSIRRVSEDLVVHYPFPTASGFNVRV